MTLKYAHTSLPVIVVAEMPPVIPTLVFQVILEGIGEVAIAT